ncbi:hypothetical protein C5167_045229 [Papaver somniferum]|uniref:Uncharacterized protein n=1 Tax=Papaver somniferum TaxID=3469 RepID=A0A4Y7LD27_PAPSO|nr:uncharacterized protein LOC113323466 [Papaver somniferum]RZC82448.1 hypothetical protein C5167_045229 [Papaver somniferum]
MAPDARLFYGDAALRRKYESTSKKQKVQKQGAKAPSAALVNPMYTRQGGNTSSVQQSQFIGDKIRERQEHQMNDPSSRLQAAQSTVHDRSGVGRTGRVLPSHAPIESPVHGGRGGGRTRPVLPSLSPIESVHEEREGGISCAVQPIESPLNNDFLVTPRRSPRGNRTGVHRNLEKEYNGLHSPMRTEGRRSVPPPVENEIQQCSNQLHNNRTQACLQPSHRSTQKSIQSSASHQSQLNALRNSSSQKSHRSQQRNSLRDSPVENHNSSQPNRSRSASNSPVANNEEVVNLLQEGQPKRTTRKKTTNLAVAKRGKEKVSVPVFDEKFCGYYKHECINSIGSWVRQRDNCPLIYDKFDDMPEQKIARVIQNVRDHFILVPDDDGAVKAIKDVMRDAYKAYRHKLHLKYKAAGGDGFAASDGHLKALAHPPENCPNKHDWAHMCNHFTTDEFKKNSERGRRAAAAKQQNGINHSNGNKSFTSTKYDLLQAGHPCDPVTFFRKTHDPEKKINAKCKEMSEKMNAMKEAADRGETNDTPEEIFNKVRNAGCSGKRRRKAHPTNYSLYQKKEEEMAELKVRMVSLEQENKRLKKETGPKATKKLLNEYFVKVGMPLMEFSSEDDAEDDDDDDDEDADMHESQIHEHRDAIEGSDREAEEEDEAFGDGQEEGDDENRDKELEEYDEEE